MQWSDDGIVLGTRRHGESSAIVELLTREHGRHLGLVHGGSGSRMKPILQAGNTVKATWRARLDEHLGHFTIEADRLRASSFFLMPHAIYGVTHIASLMRLLPERDPHPALHAAMDELLDQLDDVRRAADGVIRFEIMLLTEFGFGLDLSNCAATGVVDNLTFVSPRSGRAVSAEAGAPWAHRLLRLPAFLVAPDMETRDEDLAAGFALSGFFLDEHILTPRGEAHSDARGHFIAAVTRAIKKAA